MDMIERIARASHPHLWKMLDANPSAPGKLMSLDQAKDAIAAMREPDAVMHEALTAYLRTVCLTPEDIDAYGVVAIQAYRAMISAALTNG